LWRWIACTALVLPLGVTAAAEATFAWNPNPEPDVAGYRLYFGTPPGTFSEIHEVGNVLRYTVPDLTEGLTYSFRLTCYNQLGIESEPSDVVIYEVPGTSVVITPPPTEMALNGYLAVEDAYLQDGMLFNDGYLKVQPDFRLVYLKFDLSDLVGTVQRATLVLRQDTDPGYGTIRVYRGSHSVWTESDLTPTTAPVGIEEIGQHSGTVSPGEQISIDVTPLVTDPGTTTVILTMDPAGNDVWFASRETGSGPTLLVETVVAIDPASAAPAVLSPEPAAVAPEPAPPSVQLQMVSVGAPNRLEWATIDGRLILTWPDDSAWVLQESALSQAGWTDLVPPAASPYSVSAHDSPARFYRLKQVRTVSSDR